MTGGLSYGFSKHCIEINEGTPNQALHRVAKKKLSHAHGDRKRKQESSDDPDWHSLLLVG